MNPEDRKLLADAIWFLKHAKVDLEAQGKITGGIEVWLSEARHRLAQAEKEE